jgi:non-ribosomal peptide synthetase component F
MGQMADWTDPRIPVADVCVLRDVLERQARERPEQVAVVFPGGTEWTYAELKRRVRSVASALQAQGVRQGDHVLIWLPNGAEALLCAWGSITSVPWRWQSIPPIAAPCSLTSSTTPMHASSSPTLVSCRGSRECRRRSSSACFSSADRRKTAS